MNSLRPSRLISAQLCLCLGGLAVAQTPAAPQRTNNPFETVPQAEAPKPGVIAAPQFDAPKQADAATAALPEIGRAHV